MNREREVCDLSMMYNKQRELSSSPKKRIICTTIHTSHYSTKRTLIVAKPTL